jgi:hypothetical protein
MAREGGRGWYDFAGAMFGIAGAFNAIQGLSAIFKKEVFVEEALIYQDLQFWGWVWLIVGIVQIAAAIMLFSGQGRILGIVLAAISAVASFSSLGAFPVAALAIIAIDVLIIHGLTTRADVTVHETAMGPQAPRPEVPPRLR